MKKLSLILGDGVALALITVVGFASHGETELSYAPRMLTTFIPLLLGWFLVAPWLGFEWRGFTAAADDSMVEYVTYLEDEDERHLDHILLYNEDDCLATLQIRNWLADLSSPH